MTLKAPPLDNNSNSESDDSDELISEDGQKSSNDDSNDLFA